MAEPINDLYGFSHRVTVQQQAQRLQCDGASSRGESGWLCVAMQQAFPPGPKLKQLTRQGVPPALRTAVWMEVSGAARKQAAVSANYFSSMALAGEASPFLKDIDKDVQHTCASHPWLASPDGQAALRRVLCAYSVSNPRIGYARGMNSIAALLLVVLNRNQEAAFWLLAALVEDILAADTFIAHLVGCQVELKALDGLIADKLPRLSVHLVTLEADVSTLGAEWWLTAFSTSMPSETVARVWDSLLLEGNKVLFRTALAILKAQEEALLAYDNAGELLLAVRHYTSQCHDRDALMRMAFEGIGSLPLAVIERCRHERSAEVTAAVQERSSGNNPNSTTTQRTASGEGVHSEQLGAKVGVLGKQAASNLRKGFANLTASARELTTKRGGGSD